MRNSSGSDCLPIEGGPAPLDASCTNLADAHPLPADLDDFTEPIDPSAIRAVAGDADGLNDVWRNNRRWVAAILLAHKPRWADLDDLLQEVALSLVKKVHEVRDPGAIRPWLRTVALNVAHATARAGKVRTWVTGAQVGDADGEPDHGPTAAVAAGAAPLVDREARATIVQLASQLPDGYREPLLLKAIDNLSYREIGRIMGLPETTVETRIARARKQLRELAQAHALGD
ncbi:MAG: sigma-70 family RNA polymerase sigma factor [bacterium]|nr:sigma-70 family RNA polymerase sigma factor [bacterium]